MLREMTRKTEFSKELPEKWKSLPICEECKFPIMIRYNGLGVMQVDIICRCTWGTFDAVFDTFDGWAISELRRKAWEQRKKEKEQND